MDQDDSGWADLSELSSSFYPPAEKSPIKASYRVLSSFDERPFKIFETPHANSSNQYELPPFNLQPPNTPSFESPSVSNRYFHPPPAEFYIQPLTSRTSSQNLIPQTSSLLPTTPTIQSPSPPSPPPNPKLTPVTLVPSPIPVVAIKRKKRKINKYKRPKKGNYIIHLYII